jgi:hypothetical protein
MLGHRVCSFRADAHQVAVRVLARMPHLRTGVGVPDSNSPISDKMIDLASVLQIPTSVAWSIPAPPTVIHKAEWSKLSWDRYPLDFFFGAVLYRWAGKSHLDPEQIFSGASGHMASPLTVSS